MGVTAIVFNAGREEYAMPVSFVISIEKLGDVNPVPHLPKFMRGIVKARGELIPVLDLGNILYDTKTLINEDVRLVVIDTDVMAFGLLVNEAKEILDIPSESLQQIGLVAYQKTKYFSSIANLEERLITMIDPISLLEVLEGIHEIKEYLQEQKQEA